MNNLIAAYARLKINIFAGFLCDILFVHLQVLMFGSHQNYPTLSPVDFHFLQQVSVLGSVTFDLLVFF